MKLSIIAASIAVALTTGCTRISTGEVGVRLDASKQISGTELMPGSFNQTLIGEVLTFPTKDIVVDIQNKKPMTADNTPLDDFDITVVYALNPTAVAELYSTKSRSFHAVIDNGIFDGDTLLMYNYIQTLVNNATYKAVRQYKALEVADNRAKIEQEILETVSNQLKAEKLDNAITVSVVQIRNVTPNQQILESATRYVQSQNELLIKENEVKIAKAEAERMTALSQNAGQSIAYMNAQSQMMIAEAVKNGKVQTIIIPSNLTMLGNIK